MVSPVRQTPLWPLDAPGMPFPGECFRVAAEALGDTESQAVTVGSGANKRTEVTIGKELERVIRRCLYGYGSYSVPVKVSQTNTISAPVIPGHRWGANPEGGATGPEPCDVMVIGKMLGDGEINRRRQFIGQVGDKLLSTCNQLGIKGLSRWYVTSALKTSDPTQGKKSGISSFTNQFACLLQQELRIVRPKFILCLGADALQALFGKDMNLKKATNRVLEYTFPVHKSAEDPPEYHTVLVMACMHPGAVLAEPSHERPFQRTLGRFYQLTQGERWDKCETGLDHRIVRDEEMLERALAEMRGKDSAGRPNNPNRIVAIDAEWQGQHPQNKGAYLRCVQISWRHKQALLISLTQPGGSPDFRRIVRRPDGTPVMETKNGKRQYRMTYVGGKQRAMKMLEEALQDRRMAGFFALSDLEWLQENGCDLSAAFDAPEDWRESRLKAGLNIELMAHAVSETDYFELNEQLFRYTEVPRYDLDMEKWLKSYKALCREQGRGMDGFGDAPDEQLYPYALYDADASRRLCMVHLKRLDADEFGNNCWEVFTADQRAVLPVLEINTSGLRVDKKRLDDLTAVFLQKRNELRHELRQYFQWDEIIDEAGKVLQQPLNLESAFEVREILFGEQLNRKETHDGSAYTRLRPAGAVSLYAKPITTTGKRPKPWDEVIAEGKEDEYTPSTNKTALGILLQEARELKCLDPETGRYVKKDHYEILGKFRDYRFMNQVLKTVLRPPKTDPATQEYQLDEDGQWIYERGLGSSICSDGYVRTYIAMVLETGRWSSSRPNLQNMGKRRDKDYKRILKDGYAYSIRSIFMADEGSVLVEADYIGAELFGMAILAQDETMIAHCLRNQLPEDHPDHYDIHSHIAVLAFKLTCEPSKLALSLYGKEFGKGDLRTVAKSVVFGLAYGRGAKAIAMAAREEGTELTVEEAQAIIDAVFTLYPKLQPLFEECRKRAVTQRTKDGRVLDGYAPRFLCNSFMRYRRFEKTNDRKLMGDFEREAMNFPIQSLIADVMARAIRRIWEYRNKHGMKFKIALQIHDALIFNVPYAEVHDVITKVLPECMTGVEIHPRHLDGELLDPDAPGYRLGIDIGISENWGEQLNPEWLKERRIPVQHAGWKYHRDYGGYRHKDQKKDDPKCWVAGRWQEPKTKSVDADKIGGMNA